MKRSCTLLFCLAISVFTKAQVNKSDKLFGGSLNGRFTTGQNNSDENGSSVLGFAPSFGWAIKKNLVMGLKGTIGYNRSKNNNNGNEIRSYSIGLSPGVFLTHFQQLKNQFGITLTHDVFVGYAHSETRSGSVKTTSDSRSAGYSFSPGVYYRFSDHFFGQASFGSAFVNWSGAAGANNINAGVSFLQSFQLGINYRIGKKVG